MARRDTWINDRSGVAPSVQIASALAAAIADGTFGVGDALPGARELAAHWQVSLPTAVKAVATLRAQGWVRTVRGHGTYVRARPPELRRTLPTSDGSNSELEDLSVEQWCEDAGADRAARLELRADTTLTITRTVAGIAGQPLELRTQYTSGDLTDPVVDGPFDLVEYLLRTRMPTVVESRALNMGPGVPVLEMTQIRWRDGDLADLTDFVMRADRAVVAATHDVPSLDSACTAGTGSAAAQSRSAPLESNSVSVSAPLLPAPMPSLEPGPDLA